MNIEVELEFATSRQILLAIYKRLEKIMSALDDLTAAVASETTVNQSAITLLNGISAQITAAVAAAQAGDMAPLSGLAAQITANTTALAAAVTANTPATPPTVVPPAA